MARCLIEVPHEENTVECARAVELFLRTGSHFLTHAEWGCKDGEHRSWIIVDVDSRDEARVIVPPQYRSQAKIVGLNPFTVEDIEDILPHHNS